MSRRLPNITDENNRKSESQVFWKSRILDPAPELIIQEDEASPTQIGINKNPSMETIKRSFSQINLNNEKQGTHKRLLSKPSLSISRINNSTFYNRKSITAKSTI